jgi:hypothetical protein
VSQLSFAGWSGPVCRLDVPQKKIELGQMVTVYLQVIGDITDAEIQGVPINFSAMPYYQFKATTLGKNTVNGSITNGTDTFECSADYEVIKTPCTTWSTASRQFPSTEIYKSYRYLQVPYCSVP